MDATTSVGLLLAPGGWKLGPPLHFSGQDLSLQRAGRKCQPLRPAVRVVVGRWVKVPVRTYISTPQYNNRRAGTGQCIRAIVKCDYTS
ncbi:hypothetical protein V2G26_003588 [Clonostachys chloroleuca]